MPHRKRLRQHLKLLVAAIFGILAAGTVVFSVLEGWNLLDSLYFVTMTTTTVGYGDLVPTLTITKILTIFYSLIIIPFILYGFSILAKYEIERVYRKITGIEREQREQEKELEKTERRIASNKKLLQEQQEELEKAERKLKEQIKVNKEQQEELEGHQKKIKKQAKEIKEHDEELEVVEDIVEDVLEEEREKIEEELEGEKKK